jgi:hypothetical protein
MEYLICQDKHGYSIPIGIFTQFDLACRHVKKMCKKGLILTNEFTIWKVIKNEELDCRVNLTISLSENEYRLSNIGGGIVLTFTDDDLPEHFNIE